MIEIEVNIKGMPRGVTDPEKAISRRLLLTVIGNGFIEWIEKNFRERGAESKWVPLSPNTLLTRKRGGDVPLQDTGHLRQTLTAEPKIDEAAGTAAVGTDLPYAQYHEEGRGPFVITPKNAKVLAARLRSGGFIVYGKRVNHPGIPKRPLLPSKALAERIATEKVEAIVAEGFRLS